MWRKSIIIINAKAAEKVFSLQPFFNFAINEHDFAINEGNFAIKVHDFAINEGNFAIKELGFAINEGEFAIKEIDFTIKNSHPMNLFCIVIFNFC